MKVTHSKKSLTTVNTKDATEHLYILDSKASRPPVNPIMPRLYGHYLCPFAERVRLCLAAKQVKYQRCEINLQDKTQWHIDLNGGTVPILELPSGDVIYDSKILMEYINDAYPNQGYCMLPVDPLQRAHMRLAVITAETYFTAWQAVIAKRVFSEPEMKYFREKLALVEKCHIDHCKNGASPFFMGTKNPTLLDIHMYACLSRAYFTKGSVFNDSLFANMHFENYPKTEAFIHAMRERPEF
jgi:glutathione S-transferase